MSVFRIFLCQGTSVRPHALPLRPARRRAVTPLSNDNPSVEMNGAGPSLCQLKAPGELPEVSAITRLSAVTPATATCPVTDGGNACLSAGLMGLEDCRV